MNKKIRCKNDSIVDFSNLKKKIPKILEKIGDCYSDIYKEGILDYPMAFFSALVRVSLSK